MRKSQRLAMIAKLEHMREQQALTGFEVSRRRLEKQQSSLEQLQQYQQDYLNTSAASKQAPQQVTKLQNNSRFLADLERAVQLQHREVDRARLQCDKARELWWQLHHKRERLETLSREARQLVLADNERRDLRHAEDQWQTAARHRKNEM